MTARLRARVSAVPPGVQASAGLCKVLPGCCHCSDRGTDALRQSRGEWQVARSEPAAAQAPAMAAAAPATDALAKQAPAGAPYSASGNGALPLMVPDASAPGVLA